jgi:hypothetical protein
MIVSSSLISCSRILSSDRSSETGAPLVKFMVIEYVVYRWYGSCDKGLWQVPTLAASVFLLPAVADS